MKFRIDKVRASRDGHEYHETWTARKATQLLLPQSDLTAIAVEGLSPTDQADASDQTVQIADLTLYFGGDSFEHASRTTIAQFKYSIANEDEDFRATNTKKTVQKFSNAYGEFKSQYGAKAVEEKLGFQLVTNQPISKSLMQAVNALAHNAPRNGDIERQVNQFETASGLAGKPLAAFAQKFKLIGRTGSLPESKNELASLLVDWSGTNDPIAFARLGGLRDLVRNKAGYAGTNNNLITGFDILDVLQISDRNDLLPCDSILADVGRVLEREQLTKALSQIENTTSPLLIHSAGGVGKTVFMDTLATKMKRDYEVIFFDCFGGGTYRSPEDARHLPKKGLIHIANLLAFRSLCDPILPGSSDLQSLLRTFRRRLTQSVETISRMTPGRKLVLFIDAIDNAEVAAQRYSDDCFPIHLLESLFTKPVAGVNLVISCRTERKPNTYASYNTLELHPFSKNETAEFLRTRLENVSLVEINVGHARSGGNPRVLEYLLKEGRGLLDESEIEKKLELDDLIQQRISDALDIAEFRGCKKEETEAFVAGLAVLPPPVPLDEYANAHGVEVSAIESFASDLSPLLERTNHGLIFRDEPTETLIRNQYASSQDVLQRIATNLNSRQNVSVYAARSLPGLLHELDDGEQLLALAFDDRFPSSITSSVGKRNIRYARLVVATRHAALKKNYNSLVRLLLELSTITAADQRGAEFILDYPDLVVAARDVDATRRLFETRTSWPGTRHARIAIANALSGEFEEAYRHVDLTKGWIEYHIRSHSDNQRNELGPELPDMAAIPFFHISQGQGKDAVKFLGRWRDWYVYEVCELVFKYSHLAISLRSELSLRLDNFVNELSGIGSLSAALSFHCISQQKCRDLITKLAKRCKSSEKLDLPNSNHRSRYYTLEDGLRKSAAIALSLGLSKEGLTICSLAPCQRPSLWSLSRVFSGDVFPYIFRVAFLAAAKNKIIHEKDVLPKEIVPVCAQISRRVTGEEFVNKAREKISNCVRTQRRAGGEKKLTATLSYEKSENAQRFLSLHLEPLLALTKALSRVLGAQRGDLDKAFLNLIEKWEMFSKNRDLYSSEKYDHFFSLLGLDIALYCLWMRSEFKPDSVERFLTTVHTQEFGTHNLVRIVAVLAQRRSLQTLAGEQAIKTRALINRENDVDCRASLFGELASAMLPANINEASVYFRDGLEQMDAIGSGDYEFTNELLSFISQLSGDELEEREFHTLSNICELNLGGEAEKFPWGLYGRGFSKISGVRGLAKLSRWDDRSKITFRYTLLPYLTGLLACGKIDAKDALALNKLANSVEYYFASTKEFAEAIRKQAGPEPVVIEELINQFLDDNPEFVVDDIIGTLGLLAEKAFGQSAKITEFLASTRKHHQEVGEIQHERETYRDESDERLRQKAQVRNSNNKEELERIAVETNPTDFASLVEAINQFNALGYMYDLKDGFFEALRDKVSSYSERERYIRNIAKLENLHFGWKLEELEHAKQAWGDSSVYLPNIFENLTVPLINEIAKNLIDTSRLVASELKQVSDLTGLSTVEIAVDLIKNIACQGNSVSASVWLRLAALICPNSDKGKGQLALEHFLSSEPSRLANNAIDGPWVSGLYPNSDIRDISSGLIWRVLGSAYAAERWRGAHCIRSFAKFGRWEVVDRLVSMIGQTDAGPFQAGELPFFYMHARLWLLIALARLAIDYPDEVARYKNDLLSYALGDNATHVLMRHFAAQALISCASAGQLQLPAKQMNCLRNVALSSFPRLKKKLRTNGGFYSGRQKSELGPSSEFHLDYEFHKYDVNNLSRVFGQQCWKVADLISEVVHTIDPNVKRMYDSAGRESQYRRNTKSVTTRYHTYGQQLGYHALFFVANKLLMTYPVTDDSWYDTDPWEEWLGRYLLSRSDGLWLSDGTDRIPLDTKNFLLEAKSKDYSITGDYLKILRLVGIDSQVGKELVIKGQWFSEDDIEVRISSALVSASKAGMLARKLTQEDPMLVRLPCFRSTEYDPEDLQANKAEYIPWVVVPTAEVRLDEHDPYGASSAILRPHLAREFTKICSLTRSDSFGRIWKDKRGCVSLRVQAWGREDKNPEVKSEFGTRLFCSTEILRKILAKIDKELLILIKLERYEKKTYSEKSKFSHTIAVVRITNTLAFEFFEGRINHLQVMDY